MSRALGSCGGLTKDVWVEILSLLDFEEVIVKISRLNKYFKALSEDDVLWKKRLGDIFKYEIEELQHHPLFSWKRIVEMYFTMEWQSKTPKYNIFR